MAEAEAEVGRRIQKSAYYLKTKLRENLSVSGRTIKIVQKASGKNKGQTKKVLGAYGSNASKPGEFPRKQYGWLRQSIAQDYNPKTMTARVGTVLPYGKFLEIGTSKMRPRPWLRRTLAEEKQNIEDIINHGGTMDIKVG